MAKALIEEVASAQSFFSLRSRDYPCYDQIAKNFADILIQQVNRCLALTVNDAALVMHALKDVLMLMQTLRGSLQQLMLR
jgi:hypothetical protein